MFNNTMLIDEEPLVIIPAWAEAIGLNEAIVLQQIHYLMTTYKRVGQRENYRDGRWWVKKSIQDWQGDHFTFWSAKTVRNALDRLEKKGLVEGAFFDQDKIDRTKWYTINYDKLREVLS
jgi:hypothetical protein